MDSIAEKDFTVDEWNLIQKFIEYAEKVANSKEGITGDNYSMAPIAEAADINMYAYAKEGLMMHALWIIFFSHVKRLLPPTELKYQTIEPFLEAYDGKFDDHTPDDQKLLCETANWMSEMFKYLSARKNKGLAIQMIPKLVEGWGAKYVTGSGQTKATADRVCIFETEGGVQPAHRGGRMTASRRSYGDKARRPFKGLDSVSAGFSGSKKKKKMKKGSKKSTPHAVTNMPDLYPVVTSLPELYPVPSVPSLSTFIDYENADTDVDTDASGNSDDIYSNNKITNVGCQHPSTEMNEYFDIFRNIMALPSNSNLAAETTPAATPHPTAAPPNLLGTALALGPSNFQPLFDFSLQGGPAPHMVPRGEKEHLSLTRMKEHEWQSPQPPPLKRAYSWEQDYVSGGENIDDCKEKKIKIGDENSTEESCAAVDDKAKAVPAHAPPTFLFHDYLISHP